MSFLQELQLESKRALEKREARKDPYNRFLSEVKRLCMEEAQRGGARWEERLTALPDGEDGYYTLLPSDPERKEQCLQRLKADLPGLDIQTTFGGVYLEISWEKGK